MKNATLDELERQGSEFMKWAHLQLKRKGERCPKCMRYSVGDFQGRQTCSHCRWSETD